MSDQPELISYIPTVSVTQNTIAGQWLCPDLLSIRNIGVADGWRGHLVRGFFWVLKVVTGV